MRAGWLSRVCEDDKTISEAIKCAEKIASLSHLAVSYAKKAINKGVQPANLCYLEFYDFTSTSIVSVPRVCTDIQENKNCLLCTDLLYCTA